MAKPKPGKGYKLTDGAYAWLQNDQGGWGFNNLGLIQSRGQSLMIDVTSDLPKTGDAIKSFREMDPKVGKIDILFLTHEHTDHVFGACHEEYKNSRIICAERVHDYMGDFPPAVWLARVGDLEGDAKKQVDENVGHGDFFDFSGLKAVVPTEIFNGSMEFTIGDEKVEIYEGGSSHSPSDSMVHVPGKSYVHLGDIVTKGRLAGLTHPGFANLVTNIKQALKWDAKYYIPGHGPILVKADVAEKLDNVQWLQGEVKKRYDKGMTFEEAADDITRNLGPWKHYGGAVTLYWTVKMAYAELDGKWDDMRRHYPKFQAKTWQLKQEFEKKFPGVLR